MENLQQITYQRLLGDILNLNLLPGQKIQEAKLTEKLKISRTPIREALLHLKALGLIKAIPQSGTYIAKINLHSALNARFVRQIVEKAVSKKAASKISKQQVLNLENIIQKQKQAVLDNNGIAFFYFDNLFHKQIYLIANKKEVWTWIKQLCFQLDRFRFLRIKISNLDWSFLPQKHQQIINAIENKAYQAVGKLAYNHLNLMLKEKNEVIKQFPDYFITKLQSKDNKNRI